MQNQRIVYRQFSAPDQHLYLCQVQDPRMMKFITRKPLTKTAAIARFQKILRYNAEYPQRGAFAVYERTTGVFVGSCIARPVKEEQGVIEIGYMVQPDHWRKGYGFEMAERMKTLCLTFPEFHTIMGMIDPDNVASRRILEKCGLTFDRIGEYEGLPSKVFTYQVTPKI